MLWQTHLLVPFESSCKSQETVIGLLGVFPTKKLYPLKIQIQLISDQGTKFKLLQVFKVKDTQTS